VEELLQAIRLKKPILPILVVGALEEAQRRLEKIAGKKSGAAPEKSRASEPASEWMANPMDGIYTIIEALPKELKPLGGSQMQVLRPDPDFRRDMEQVVKAAWTHISNPAPKPSRAPNGDADELE
jgi:hypothetical protein